MTAGGLLASLLANRDARTHQAGGALIRVAAAAARQCRLTLTQNNNNTAAWLFVPELSLRLCVYVCTHTQ